MPGPAAGGDTLRQTPFTVAPPERPYAESAGSSAAVANIGRLLNERDFRAALGGIGERRFRELLAAGIVPAPLELGPRAPRWTQDDVAITIGRLRRRDPQRPEPETLARARRERIERLKRRVQP